MFGATIGRGKVLKAINSHKTYGKSTRINV